MFEVFSSGEVLCELVQLLSDAYYEEQEALGNSLTSPKKKIQIIGVLSGTQTERPCVQNIEKALNVIWARSPHVKNMPTPQQIYVGDSGPTVSLMREMFDIYVMRGIWSRARDMFAWYTERCAHYGWVLPPQLHKKGNLQLRRDIFSSGTVICMVCLSCGGGKEWVPETLEKQEKESLSDNSEKECGTSLQNEKNEEKEKKKILKSSNQTQSTHSSEKSKSTPLASSSSSAPPSSLSAVYGLPSTEKERMHNIQLALTSFAHMNVPVFVMPNEWIAPSSSKAPSQTGSKSSSTTATATIDSSSGAVSVSASSSVSSSASASASASSQSSVDQTLSKLPAAASLLREKAKEIRRSAQEQADDDILMFQLDLIWRQLVDSVCEEDEEENESSINKTSATPKNASRSAATQLKTPTSQKKIAQKVAAVSDASPSSSSSSFVSSSSKPQSVRQTTSDKITFNKLVSNVRFADQEKVLQKVKEQEKEKEEELKREEELMAEKKEDEKEAEESEKAEQMDNEKTPQVKTKESKVLRTPKLNKTSRPVSTSSASILRSSVLANKKQSSPSQSLSEQPKETGSEASTTQSAISDHPIQTPQKDKKTPLNRRIPTRTVKPKQKSDDKKPLESIKEEKPKKMEMQKDGQNLTRNEVVEKKEQVEERKDTEKTSKLNSQPPATPSARPKVIPTIKRKIVSKLKEHALPQTPKSKDSSLQQEPATELTKQNEQSNSKAERTPTSQSKQRPFSVQSSANHTKTDEKEISVRPFSSLSMKPKFRTPIRRLANSSEKKTPTKEDANKKDAEKQLTQAAPLSSQKQEKETQKEVKQETANERPKSPLIKATPAKERGMIRSKSPISAKRPQPKFQSNRPLATKSKTEKLALAKRAPEKRQDAPENMSMKSKSEKHTEASNDEQVEGKKEESEQKVEETKQDLDLEKEEDVNNTTQSTTTKASSKSEEDIFMIEEEKLEHKKEEENELQMCKEHSNSKENLEKVEMDSFEEQRDSFREDREDEKETSSEDEMLAFTIEEIGSKKENKDEDNISEWRDEHVFTPTQLATTQNLNSSIHSSDSEADPFSAVELKQTQSSFIQDATPQLEGSGSLDSDEVLHSSLEDDNNLKSLQGEIEKSNSVSNDDHFDEIEAEEISAPVSESSHANQRPLQVDKSACIKRMEEKVDRLFAKRKERTNSLPKIDIKSNMQSNNVLPLSMYSSLSVKNDLKQSDANNTLLASSTVFSQLPENSVSLLTSSQPVNMRIIYSLADSAHSEKKYSFESQSTSEKSDSDLRLKEMEGNIISSSNSFEHNSSTAPVEEKGEAKMGMICDDSLNAPNNENKTLLMNLNFDVEEPILCFTERNEVKPDNMES
ncbi:uncharacterized protein MONOS_9212 [Monocercomonoides exilis]|uniref:uncharacterized protein n=1 Tax=Monocercomonoides exilis TaxID=2049356 RepID=UPI0035596F4D|nr:hypothetical protein MONOS_9212 [Monocercomonoides exilis]|eukprot:MONOS_9212.1-p1 / transcript=MONOS_9212.1 / gene=MONOS_9212 / organism=Monocercomonoides_exilis_PA203 / gene_product=unspecified product / transcript_product=unspecified product / location=Mono_scaffold00371:51954-56255(+) / protein_length=1356 / sequence_SO=supercontig / SO=protein_coding / is_pseudo=false